MSGQEAAGAARMKIVFSVLTPASLRNFESVVRELAERGHRVHLAIHTGGKPEEGEPLPERLARELANVSTDRAPTPKGERWQGLAIWLRSCRDYLQFLDPVYNASYRARADQRVPGPFKRLVNSRGARRPFAKAAIGRCLTAMLRMIPPSPTIKTYLAAQDADLIMLTPYIGLRTVQPDYLRAAQALGLRSAVCVLSWDNLSSKSLMWPLPEMVTVWNETQRDEAVRLHGARRDTVAVTGAQCYDHWFERSPSAREEFMRGLGLDPAREMILYLCFSPFKGAASEAEFVTGWVERVRASGDSRLAEAGLLIRPHPKRRAQWLDVDLSRFGNVAIHPLEGPFTADAKAMTEYYDSIFHSKAVVGLNTSAMIEAGIVGRPVLTVLAPEFEESQVGTLHFRYLMEVGGGLLRVGHDFDEHLAQLSGVLGTEEDGSALEFVGRFVRPAGLDRRATDVYVAAIERLGAEASPRRRSTPWWSWPLRPFLWLAAARLEAAQTSGGAS
jgi:hypothetical protein